MVTREPPSASSETGFVGYVSDLVAHCKSD